MPQVPAAYGADSAAAGEPDGTAPPESAPVEAATQQAVPDLHTDQASYAGRDPHPGAHPGLGPHADPAAHPGAGHGPLAPHPRPAPQRGPLGSQTEGMAAIRAVWERAAESERRRPARPGRPHPRREPKRLGPALLGVLVCACLLMFFAWAAAPALWISVGHSQSGTATVTSCQTGFAPSCTGVFSTGDWSKELALTGEVTADDLGAALPARATGPDAHNAYVGGTGGLVLRWAPALVLFMAAAFALVAVSGATRLYEGRSAAIGLSWAAAGAVLAVALAFAW
ncbi:hypothetical protein LO763_18120 [Glycomyces sp. A-F 0318]|uniref:hypothetical protein n=1 Tax=Glycomyces amatae TaxID=2881355 RepID=UPI001E48C148|nr:hypothetical protein [Glycomyces amatae]MCD0445531.1 hypothetical protein [Glycomyces amatae]